MSEPSPRPEVRRYGSTAGIGLAGRIWPCYDEVFGDFDDFRTWSDDLFTRHAVRSGYRLVVATEGSAVAGFGWGYIGERGQYWTDLVCDALPGSVADEGRRSLRVRGTGRRSAVPASRAGPSAPRQPA